MSSGAAAASEPLARPCPTRVRPPPMSALRLPEDVPAASVAAVELTLVDGKKVTLSRAAAAREANLGPGVVPGGTRYGGAPVSLGAGVRPGDVLSAAALLRGGGRVELAVPAAEAGTAVAEPAGCWRPRANKARPVGVTWNGFDQKAARVLPAVEAVQRPAAAGIPIRVALPSLHEHKALGVDVVRSDDGSVSNTADEASALGGFLAPVFATGR